ncbi:hypothetical protein B7Y94_01910 [Candidatus Saccharibacteria bacterium 32-49-12]|nr:MAG: hypothetical protein B7Y94_01910 [Candidatus Saccharibacteria bacterium 32-49-12]
MSLRTWLQRPISTLNISARFILGVVVVQLLVSVGLSAILSNDPNWSRWHISYLGEGDIFSAHFFNVSMWVAGALVGWFGWAFYQELKKAKASSSELALMRPGVILAGISAIAVCIYLVGLFPRSFGVLPHDIFGHAIYFIFLALCVSAPWILPGMSRWFYAASYLIHAAIIGLFILYWSGLSESLYLAEVATFAFFILWVAIIIRQAEVNG